MAFAQIIAELRVVEAPAELQIGFAKGRERVELCAATARGTCTNGFGLGSLSNILALVFLGFIAEGRVLTAIKGLSVAIILVLKAGGVSTLICEAPKVEPYRDAMRHRISEILGVEIAAVNVKATTTERLGFTGRGEGIAAQAVATAIFP